MFKFFRKNKKVESNVNNFNEEKLYKIINKNIRDIRKGFNVGVSTSNDGDVNNINNYGGYRTQ